MIGNIRLSSAVAEGNGAKATKKTKGNATGAAAAPQKDKDSALEKARHAQASALSKDRLFFVKDTDKKLAPQAQVIVNTLKAAGKAGMTRKELCDALPAAGLQTKQPVGRILSYYQKAIVECGAVTIEAGKPDAAPAPAA